MSLNQFFGYFGAKHALARRYPAPRFETIVEPFAGSAGYATHHHGRRVLLVERDPRVANVWRYLLRVTPRELLSLPDLTIGQLVDDLDVCEEARDLISYWCGPGAGHGRSKLSPQAADNPDQAWGRIVRARLASQVDKIRHWRVIEGDYSEAPDVEATWFVDPPYEVAGSAKQYRQHAGLIDFAKLGAWCRSRRGQVIVCENEGAAWLPFRRFRDLKSTGGTVSREVIWTNDGEEQAQAASA